MNATHQLGDLQLAIMRILWERGEATAGDIHTALHDERGLAFTTISTMLVKMEQKGVVCHRAEGRRFIYSATISEQSVQRGMVSELTQRLFKGKISALVSHLISDHGIDRQELADLKALIASQSKTKTKPKAKNEEE